jgi:hypothetical protein
LRFRYQTGKLDGRNGLDEVNGKKTEAGKEPVPKQTKIYFDILKYVVGKRWYLILKIGYSKRNKLESTQLPAHRKKQRFEPADVRQYISCSFFP